MKIEGLPGLLAGVARVEAMCHDYVVHLFMWPSETLPSVSHRT
jgi:hypothetical protein